MKKYFDKKEICFRHLIAGIGSAYFIFVVLEMATLFFHVENLPETFRPFLQLFPGSYLLYSRNGEDLHMDFVLMLFLLIGAFSGSIWCIRKHKK